MIAVKALHNLNANLDIPVGIEHFDEEETLSAKVNLDMSANNIQTLSLLLKNKTGNNILMPFNILTWVLNETQVKSNETHFLSFDQTIFGVFNYILLY